MAEDEKVEKNKDSKLVNGDIFEASDSFQKLVAMDFPIPDAIALRELVQKLDGPLKIIIDMRNGLIRKHGQDALKVSGQLEIIGPNDKKRRPMSKSFPSFAKAITELMNQEVKLDFKKVKLPSKVDGEPIKLSVLDLDRLEKFVEVYIC